MLTQHDPSTTPSNRAIVESVSLFQRKAQQAQGPVISNPTLDGMPRLVPALQVLVHWQRMD